PEECARQARRGDGWIKIVADWIDRSMGADAVVAPLFEPEIVKDAFAAAHENGARVTAHTFSTEAIGPLLEADIDCIEHGSGMLPEHIEEAARRGIPVTPTLIQSENFADFAEAGAAKFPAYAEQMRWLYERRFELVRRLVGAGVQILAGSDAGGTLEHGTLPDELGLWVQAGIDPLTALELATWRARRYLASGPGHAAERAARTGLREGAPADFVYYAEDPAEALLTGRLEPTTVVRAGEEFGG
ncbi:MAG: amidohydrolase family protein, partial [Bowdeniella nasicola]|nr:amidohydrolase family protein [Bowdeniella nasicola]